MKNCSVSPFSSISLRYITILPTSYPASMLCQSACEPASRNTALACASARSRTDAAVTMPPSRSRARVSPAASPTASLSASPSGPAGRSRTQSARRPVTNGRTMSIQSQKSCSLLALRSSPGQPLMAAWQARAQSAVMNRAISAPRQRRLGLRQHVLEVGGERDADHGQLLVQLVHEQRLDPLLRPPEGLVVDVARAGGAHGEQGPQRVVQVLHVARILGEQVAD